MINNSVQGGVLKSTGIDPFIPSTEIRTGENSSYSCVNYNGMVANCWSGNSEQHSCCLIYHKVDRKAVVYKYHQLVSLLFVVAFRQSLEYIVYTNNFHNC